MLVGQLNIKKFSKTSQLPGVVLPIKEIQPGTLLAFVSSSEKIGTALVLANFHSEDLGYTILIVLGNEQITEIERKSSQELCIVQG